MEFVHLVIHSFLLPRAISKNTGNYWFYFRKNVIIWKVTYLKKSWRWNWQHIDLHGFEYAELSSSEISKERLFLSSPSSSSLFLFFSSSSPPFFFSFFFIWKFWDICHYWLSKHSLYSIPSISIFIIIIFFIARRHRLYLHHSHFIRSEKPCISSPYPHIGFRDQTSQGAWTSWGWSRRAIRGHRPDWGGCGGGTSLLMRRDWCPGKSTGLGAGSFCAGQQSQAGQNFCPITHQALLPQSISQETCRVLEISIASCQIGP